MSSYTTLSRVVFRFSRIINEHPICIYLLRSRHDVIHADCALCNAEDIKTNAAKYLG